MIKKMNEVALLTIGAMALAGFVAAQSYPTPAQPAAKPAEEKTAHQHAKASGDKATHQAKVSATLVEPEKKAAEQAATVKVVVTGMKVVDPAVVKEKPRAGQGHLHYQVDDGPVIATTALKLSFHGLKPGMHKITVTPAGNDHAPVGAAQVLEVTIPAGTAAR